MGNLKRRQCSVCLIFEYRNEQIPKRRSILYKNWEHNPEVYLESGQRYMTELSLWK